MNFNANNKLNNISVLMLHQILKCLTKLYNVNSGKNSTYEK